MVTIMYNNNGRVHLLDDQHVQPFERVVDNGKKWSSIEKESLKSHVTETEVSKLFFSQLNIDALQQGIRYKVYKESGGKYVIGNQSVDELRIIMRSVFLTNAKNLPYQFVEQVRDLNAIVLDYCVKEITSQLDMNAKFKQDISQLPMPMEYGISQSVKGTKIAEHKRF